MNNISPIPYLQDEYEARIRLFFNLDMDFKLDLYLKHYSHHKNLGLAPISECFFAWNKIKTKNFDAITNAAYSGLKTFDYEIKTSSIADKFLNLIRR